MRRMMATAALWPLLWGCNGDSGSSISEISRSTAVAPEAATGPGCAGIHGDPPRPLTSSSSAGGQALTDLLFGCESRSGEILEWADQDGTPRQACLHVPAQASRAKRLPLVAFLQGSILPADPQTFYTGWELLNGTADLTGDPARPGFILLVPFGRDTAHFYPAPDDTGLGWDNWYRNFDRSDPTLNRDAGAIDHFISEVKSRGIVDDRRVYIGGWSNGAAMGILYTLNTRGIAAAAVYSNPEPFSDVADPCAQRPFGNNLRPIFFLHNDCDIIGICQTGGEQFEEKMASAMPLVEVRSVIIDLLDQEVSSCVDLCSYDSSNPISALTPGAVRHVTWPYAWNDRMFAFLREHPLP